MDTTYAQVTQETVAAEVRAWLGRRNLSGRKVARELGWTEPYISRRLTGAVPFDVTDLIKIANFLDVPVAAFFETPERVSLRSSPPLGMLGIRGAFSQVSGDWMLAA